MAKCNLGGEYTKLAKLALPYGREIKPPVIGWIIDDQIDHTPANAGASEALADQQIIDGISDLNLPASIPAIFFGFFSILLYRYSYQNEFELQYARLENSDPTDRQNLPLQGIQLFNPASVSIEELSTVLDQLCQCPEDDHQSTHIKKSAFCVLESDAEIPNISSTLQEIFKRYGGVIWAVIDKPDGLFRLRWLCGENVPTDRLDIMQLHIRNLIESAKKQPPISMSDQHMLSAAEIQHQIDSAIGETCELDSQPIYKHIEKHAQTQPEKMAVRFDGKQFSYAEINHRANHLANAMLEAGADIGSHIAVYIKPSEAVIVALLAIHKIGCVYVPIDPTFPPARTIAILDEIKPAAIVCDDLGADVFETLGSTLLDVTTYSDVKDSVENPDLPVLESHISHIFFTSGTTGKPKGTLATQKNLIHYVSTAKNRYKFDDQDLFISAARFTFSISLFELITPLYTGGSVNILQRETVLDLKLLCQEIASSTVFHFGPSLLKQLLPYIENNFDSYDLFNGLRHVSSGGDMVPPEILEKLKRIFRNAEVFIIYGSSEISCMGCTYEAPRNETVTQSFVGKPHQNVSVRIFDMHGNTVPVGVPGRVHFSGPGLVSGYLNMPALTKEKFRDIDGERFYDIGDVGRLDPQGNLQLLGREDFQIQLRGMRIELLEVEACLKNHPAIVDCVIVARPLRANDDKSLIAYVVAANTDAMLSASELIDFASRNLPDYMVPSVFVHLEKFPVNHNGKLDRAQLPDPSVENMLVSASFKEASNEIEQELIFMWESLFGIQGIGTDHDFFELGGDSLLAINFLIEVDKRFNKFIPISLLMQASNISALAELITSDNPIEGVGDVVVLRKGNTEPPLFCLYGVLLYKDLAESIDTERMVCGVYLQQEVGIMATSANDDDFQVLSTIEGIVSCYIDRIRAFQPTGPYYLCGESFGGIIALEVARQLEREGEDIKLVAMFDSVAPGFYESLSKAKRAFIHMRQLRQYGLSYLKQKLEKRIPAKTKKYEDVEILDDVRGKIRDNASKSYQPEKYDGKVTLFKARERSEFEPQAEDLGWGKYIQALEILEIDGSHLSILQKGNVEMLASLVLDRMN